MNRTANANTQNKGTITGKLHGLLVLNTWTDLVTGLPPSLQNEDSITTEKKLYETNSEIAYNQIAKQYFERFAKRRFFAKGD